jgi:hypothetical protein
MAAFRSLSIQRMVSMFLVYSPEEIPAGKVVFQNYKLRDGISPCFETWEIVKMRPCGI